MLILYGIYIYVPLPKIPREEVEKIYDIVTNDEYLVLGTVWWYSPLALG